MMRWIPIALFALLIALLAGVLRNENTPQTELKTDISPMVDEQPNLPALTPLGHDMNLHDISNSDTPVVLNLFASWCTPCLAEHPLLQSLEQNGATVYGIGWRDKEENIRNWLNEHGNPFTAVWMDTKGEAAIPLGLRGVPETYILHKGKVTFHHAGVLTETLIREQMLPLLEEHS